MLLCLAIFCENFVTFQRLTIYYETYIKLLDLFHQAFSSLNSDREPDVYYHTGARDNCLNFKQNWWKNKKILNVLDNIQHLLAVPDLPVSPPRSSQESKSATADTLEQLQDLQDHRKRQYSAIAGSS